MGAVNAHTVLGKLLGINSCAAAGACPRIHCVRAVWAGTWCVQLQVWESGVHTARQHSDRPGTLITASLSPGGDSLTFAAVNMP